MKKVLLLTAMVAGLCGCMPTMPPEQYEMVAKSAELKFTYDYNVPNTDKAVLWKRARDYFAGAYGDSRAVFRVMDENDGTIIGKGVDPWVFSGLVPCSTEYHIRFVAKENKARLQFELINTVPVTSKCTGYPLPTRQAYNELVASFQSISQSLESALVGNGTSNDFKNF